MRNMRFDKLARGIAALIILAAAAGGCSRGAELRYNGREGVPLAELDTSGPAPAEVTLLGPDRVLISHGDAFTVTVDGGAERAADLRFVLAEGSLGIMRANGRGPGSRAATIRVTLPAPPARLSVAGSGEMISDELAGAAELSIAGSGSLATPQVASDTLDISIAGSGSYRAAGRARTLDLSVAGSGDADLGRLLVGRAAVSIAGSGDTVLASDGEVSASIMGSGNVTVRGDARCTLASMGSGTLTCERGERIA